MSPSSPDNRSPSGADLSAYEVDGKVWTRNPKKGASNPAWVTATIKEKSASGDLTVELTSTKLRVTAHHTELPLVETVAPLTGYMAENFVSPSAPAVLHNVVQRYSSERVYTQAGKTLVAVNPYASLPSPYSRNLSLYDYSVMYKVSRRS